MQGNLPKDQPWLLSITIEADQELFVPSVIVTLPPTPKTSLGLGMLSGVASALPSLDPLLWCFCAWTSLEILISNVQNVQPQNSLCPEEEEMDSTSEAMIDHYLISNLLLIEISWSPLSIKRQAIKKARTLQPRYDDEAEDKKYQKVMKPLLLKRLIYSLVSSKPLSYLSRMYIPVELSLRYPVPSIYTSTGKFIRFFLRMFWSWLSIYSRLILSAFGCSK